MRQGPSRLEWQGAYEAAILETDDSKLLEKVNAAEVVMLRRVECLVRWPGDREAYALADALSALHVLRRERLLSNRDFVA